MCVPDNKLDMLVAMADSFAKALIEFTHCNVDVMLSNGFQADDAISFVFHSDLKIVKCLEENSDNEAQDCQGHFQAQNQLDEFNNTLNEMLAQVSNLLNKEQTQ